MNPLLVSYSDRTGGAARAAFRLQQALRGYGLSSELLVLRKKGVESWVRGPKSALAKGWGMARGQLGRTVMRLQNTPNAVLHSVNILPGGLFREIQTCNADIVNLHWVNEEALSIEAIGRIQKPIVWTLHDMWAFCGAEHISSCDGLARWQIGYRRDNRGAGHTGLDMDRWVWQRKRRAWRRPIHIVTPSRWLAECARNSVLMRDWPVTVIPNVIDTRQFQPWPKTLARNILGLPTDVPLILFGVYGGLKDNNKGWDLLQSALAGAVRARPDLHGVIFGQAEPINPPAIGLTLHWMGHVHDDATLALLYSAADVMVVPSRQENLPQAGTEAQACGCPVVAFNATGLKDVVVHGATGYLAVPYDAEDLANGILWVLEDRERYSHLSAAARARAVSLWAEEVVVPQYLAVYQQAIDAFRD